MSRRRLLPAALVIAVVAALASAAPAATPPIPSSMSALGDSITRAFNACGFYFDCTSRSWSTGSSVNSHYVRIRVKNPVITFRNFNDARSGAKMRDLDGQAQSAAARGVQYVTILMGANDACTSTEAAMTSVATFQAQFQQAMATLTTRLPSAAIFVASIPDIRRLWDVGRVSSSARSTWALFGICQSMLANPTSTAQGDVDRRQRVWQRVVDFNAVLAAVCGQYATCKFDGNAVFNFPFTLSHVSSWDYFHPNTNGQQVLAQITYAAGFGW
jgi:lysophospholipase L1-like esterase